MTRISIYREDSLGALYRAVANKLMNASPIWTGRVYPDDVDQDVVRPYVVFAYTAGGEANEVGRPDADYLLTVKVVADTQQLAMDGSARLAWLLNDQGVQDHPETPLNGGDDWEVITSTVERRVHIKDRFSGTKPIFHDGHQIRFKMEARK